MPERDSKLYNWKKTCLSSGPSSLNAKIRKETESNEGGAQCGVIEKLDSLIASRARMHARRVPDTATEFSRLHLI